MSYMILSSLLEQVFFVLGYQIHYAYTEVFTKTFEGCLVYGNFENWDVGRFFFSDGLYFYFIYFFFNLIFIFLREGYNHHPAFYSKTLIVSMSSGHAKHYGTI